MVIIPEVPNVISGIAIIGFFFFLQKVAQGPRVPTPLSLTFLDSSYIFFLTEKKSKKGGCSAGQ